MEDWFCTSTAAALVNELVEAADYKRLSRTITRDGRIDLLRLDEAGYIKLDRRGAELLFQVFTERGRERASIAIASNAAFSEWTATFTDPPLVRLDRRPAHLRRAHHPRPAPAPTGCAPPPAARPVRPHRPVPEGPPP